MHVHMHTYILSLPLSLIHPKTHTQLSTCACADTHACVCTRTHMHVLTHALMHTYTHIQNDVDPSYSCRVCTK